MEDYFDQKEGLDEIMIIGEHATIHVAWTQYIDEFVKKWGKENFDDYMQARYEFCQKKRTESEIVKLETKLNGFIEQKNHAEKRFDFVKVVDLKFSVIPDIEKKIKKMKEEIKST